jgi:hypothetical protein
MKELIRMDQSDKGVPSSANWKPTNPFNNKHQKVAQPKPMCIAVNHYYNCLMSILQGYILYKRTGYAVDDVGMMPVTNNISSRVVSIYK